MENKKYNLGKSILLLINAIGIVLLVYLSIVYFSFNMEVNNPDAMLPITKYEGAGVLLTFGLIPLLITNILGFIFIKAKNKLVRLLFFVPSVVCIFVVCHYLFIGPGRINSGAESEKAIFTINIENQTDDLYGLGFNYGFNDSVDGSMMVANADYSLLTDEIIDFPFNAQMLSDSTIDYSKFYFYLEIMNSEESAKNGVSDLETEKYSTEKCEISVVEGDTYTFILTGNDKDGYSLIKK